jgi:hypothetical protein
LKLWQRANRLWCNTVTGGLHRPLGKWLFPGPQLRRAWPFYFDPDTQTLWSKTGEGFNVHSCILFGRNWRPTQFHFLLLLLSQPHWIQQEHPGVIVLLITIMIIITNNTKLICNTIFCWSKLWSRCWQCYLAAAFKTVSLRNIQNNVIL